MGRARARDLGIVIGTLPPGKKNAITDVPGVRVGHTTLVEGDNVRTGVTVVLPHEGSPALSSGSTSPLRCSLQHSASSSGMLPSRPPT